VGVVVDEGGADAGVEAEAVDVDAVGGVVDEDEPVSVLFCFVLSTVGEDEGDASEEGGAREEWDDDDDVDSTLPPSLDTPTDRRCPAASEPAPTDDAGTVPVLVAVAVAAASDEIADA